MVRAKELLAVMRILPDPGSLEGVRVFKSTVITICVCCERGVRQNQCQGSQTQTIGEFCSDTEMSCDPESQTRGQNNSTCLRPRARKHLKPRHSRQHKKYSNAVSRNFETNLFAAVKYWGCKISGKRKCSQLLTDASRDFSEYLEILFPLLVCNGKSFTKENESWKKALF